MWLWDEVKEIAEGVSDEVYSLADAVGVRPKQIAAMLGIVDE